MDNQKPYLGLGEKIRERRKSLGFNIKQISASIGIDRTYISKVENGQIRPSLDVLNKLIGYLSLELPSVIDLYKLAGYTNDKIRFKNEPTHKMLNNSDNKTVTPGEQQAAEVLIPDDVSILYTDSVFLTINQYGATLEVAQRLGSSNKHKVVARVGMSNEHLKALRDLLNKSIKEGEVA